MEILWAAGLWASSTLTRLLPARPRYAVAGVLGRWYSRFFPAKRRAVQENLAWINARTGKKFQTDDVFAHFGRTLSDFFSGCDVEISIEGREKAEEARRRGHGVLILTSHLGNWELGGRVLSDWGWPVTAVFQPYRSRVMQNFIQRRRASSLRYLAVGKGAAHGMRQVLARGESIAILGDRPFGEDGAGVTLFGRRARLPRGPFVFACRFGAPILPAFVIVDGPGRYRAVIEDPLWPEGKGANAPQILLDKMAQVLERYLSRYGDQWFCFEPGWE